MKILLALSLLFVLAFTGAAQDATGTPTEPAEPSAFLRALSLIPDTPAVRAAIPLFNYADYHASLATRGITVPENVESVVDEGMANVPWIRSLAGGPPYVLQFVWRYGVQFPETVGFDFFQVAQAVEFGNPPVNGRILIGDFDTGTIGEALARRGYNVERQDEQGMLLCPAGGCAEGMTSEPSLFNRGNPLGGDMGRNEILFASPGLLLSSAGEAEVEAMIDTYTGGAPSLADDPAYQALANVLAAYPYVNIVTAFSPLGLGAPAVLAFTRDQEFIDRRTAAIEAYPISPYAAIAFASTADDEHEYGLALLVYVNADAAQDAAAAIDNRLAELESVETQQTYAGLLNELGTLEPAQVVADDTTGLSVVVARVSKPMPSNEAVDGEIPWSHRLYLRFLQMVYDRDVPWLVWDSGAE